MKRISLTILVLFFAVVLAAPAFASEVNMKGQFEMSARWLDNLNFSDSDNDKTSEDDFTIDQRIRVYFEYVANENLRGVFGIESNNDWGKPGAGALGDDPKSMSLKHAYIDFLWPNTDLHFRAGRFSFTTPANFCSPIWKNDISGITAGYKFNDQVSIAIAYLRLLDVNYDSDGVGKENQDDELDAVYVNLPITGSGWNLNPFAMYYWVGKDAFNTKIQAGKYAGGLNGGFSNVKEDESSNGYWVGVPFSMTLFDPWTFYTDVFYGAFDADKSQNDRSGWLVDAAAEYAWADLFTLRVLGFYGSGDDDDVDDGSERLPTLGNNEGKCGYTSFGFDGSNAKWTGKDQLLTGNGYGFWGVGVSFMDFSFVENLKHTVTFLYGQGTNDESTIKKIGGSNTPGFYDGGVYLTEEDSYFEVNFNNAYKIYKNLTAYVEFGYISLDVDEDVWGEDDTEPATKATFTLRYCF